MLSQPAAIDVHALYHCEEGSNSTKKLVPEGTGPLSRSSINGIRGTAFTKIVLGELPVVDFGRRSISV